jgi:hypothetical protein
MFRESDKMSKESDKMSKESDEMSKESDKKSVQSSESETSVGSCSSGVTLRPASNADEATWWCQAETEADTASTKASPEKVEPRGILLTSTTGLDQLGVQQLQVIAAAACAPGANPATN